MTHQDHQWLTLELEHCVDVIDFQLPDEDDIHSLAINLDNAQMRVRDMRVKLALQKAQKWVREAYHYISGGEDEVASEMLATAQYWLHKAAPTLE